MLLFCMHEYQYRAERHISILKVGYHVVLYLMWYMVFTYTYRSRSRHDHSITCKCCNHAIIICKTQLVVFFYP